VKMIAEQIPGYAYGSQAVGTSRISLEEFAELKASVGFTDQHVRDLAFAGEVLKDQTKEIVHHWRVRIIGEIPNLARHTRALDGSPLPEYAKLSGLRFEQWILDTCFRPYDRAWLDYQEEIALRHTSLKKNVTDSVASTSYVPLRDIIGFIAVINETLKPYLAARGATAELVERMYVAWCRSIQLQLALWSRPYADAALALDEW
jgi:hypothetical protein